jgi:mannose-6-phosphate isomerase-like protein (cupin superfamily)
MQPKHFQPGEGKTFNIGRMSMTFKTTAGENWNAYTVCEAMEPPESGAGYHRHPTYDETFIICEGHYDFRLDGKLLKLGAGDVVFVPRGIAHGFVSTGPEGGRALLRLAYAFTSAARLVVKRFATKLSTRIHH